MSEEKKTVLTGSPDAGVKGLKGLRPRQLEPSSPGIEPIPHYKHPLEPTLSTHVAKRAKLTREQIKEITAEVEEMVAYPGGEKRAIQVVRKKYGISKRQVERLVKAVFDAWHREDERNRKFTKAQAIRRLTKHIQTAATAGKWTVVAMLEERLARIQGTEEAQVIKVDATLGPAIGGVLAGLDVSTLERMAKDYDALLSGKSPSLAPAPAPAHVDIKVIDVDLE